MKIGIFGGSFDPVHLGHLLLAEQCLDAASLDQIWFIPAATPPHKQEIRLTRPDYRLTMLQLATGGNDRFEIDTCEIDRQGVSYTVDTLRFLKEKKPGDDFYLLMGADSLDDFHTWKDPEEICQLAIPVICRRPGANEIDYDKLSSYVDIQRLKKIRSVAFESRIIGISSSEIRDLVKNQQSIRYQTPRAVEQFILEKNLYLSSGEDISAAD